MADFTALKTAIQTYIKQNGNEEITGEKLQEILLSMVTTLGDSAINDLITALNDEVAARQNADGTLQQNITNEETARGNADTALSNRLGSTITAENTAADQIGAEAEARAAADTALQNLIDGITDNIENGYVYAGIATPSSTPATGKVFYLALTAGTYTNFGNTVVSQGINILKYNGSAWSLDAFIGIDDELTPSSNNLPKSGNVLENIIKNGSAFDLSAYNAEGGVLATYADLSAALTALNLLPAVYKQGGMSLRFARTSDNKYIQARCMAQNFTTDVTQWQGVDDMPTDGSDNLVKSGGALQSEYALVGIVAKTVKPNSGWYGSITGQRFNIVANKQYAIYNVGSSKAVSIRLFDANSEVVETKDVNIEAGANSIVSFAHNAVAIDIFFNGTSNELDFYEVDSYRVEIDKLQQGLRQTDNNVGYISKVVKPSSGWGGSISGYIFDIVSGTEYYLSNTGESKATSIRLYNANSEVVETKDVNIEAGASAKVIFSHDAVRIDIFFNGSNNVLGFYIADSFGGELRVDIDTLQKGLEKTVNDVGYISKFTKATSGWGGTYYGYIFNIKAGVKYYLTNMGESRATSIRLYNANSEKVEEKDLMLAAGASAEYTFAHDAVSVDVFFSGSNNILEFYTSDSVGGELQSVKESVPALTDSLGDSDKTVPTQRLLKFHSNSIFENYYVIGAGIVGFGVKKDYPNIANVKKFRFNTYSFNNNVLYGDIQGLVDDNWINLDSINHTKGTDNIEIVESAYSRFFVVINYDLLYPTGMIYRDLDWQIRNSAVQFVTKDIYGKLKDLIGYVAIPSYELKDSSVVNISVKKDGTGDFTTIGDAIASIGSATQRNEKSSFEKQYCIRVFPGVYNEVNLFIPDYVHIYGLHPNTVIVTSVGLTPEGKPPVFDMYGNSKLSNMTIISAFGYCVHVDSGRGSRTCVCENLYCKKVYNATSLNPNGDDVRNNGWISDGYVNPSVIGMGMGINEYKFVFKNCTFENGWVAAHTNANNDSIPNTRIEYHNCKLVNAIIDLQTLDNSGGTYHTDGKYICIIDNVITQRGRVSLRLDYYENNSAWTVEGGANKNFSTMFNNLDGVSESWNNINTTEKDYIQLASGVSCVKDQFIDCDGNICTGATLKEEIFGIALDSMSADSLDAVSVWIGKAFKVSLTDGEYGIGNDGKLSANATNKIGKVKNGILYRY